MESLRKTFLEPDGWEYFHVVETGAFFKKVIHQTSDGGTVLIHHIPSGVLNRANRPVFVFEGGHSQCFSDYIEKNILSIPFSMSLDLGELDIDLEGKEYIELLMELHDRRRENFKNNVAEMILDDC